MNGFGYKSVRMHGVDADPDAIGVNQFPSVGEFSVAIGALGNVDGGTGIFTPHHAAGVGAVCGDDFAAGETHVGEKAFVTLDEGAADESRREAHGDGYSRRILRFPTHKLTQAVEQSTFCNRWLISIVVS